MVTLIVYKCLLLWKTKNLFPSQQSAMLFRIVVSENSFILRWYILYSVFIRYTYASLKHSEQILHITCILATRRCHGSKPDYPCLTPQTQNILLLLWVFSWCSFMPLFQTSSGKNVSSVNPFLKYNTYHYTKCYSCFPWGTVKTRLFQRTKNLVNSIIFNNLKLMMALCLLNMIHPGNFFLNGLDFVCSLLKYLLLVKVKEIKAKMECKYITLSSLPLNFWMQTLFILLWEPFIIK